MANVKLDFSKMKHVSSDEHTTTLKHPAGHEIRLTHKALSPENQKALSALAKISQASQTPMQSDEMKHMQMKDGGRVSGPNNPKLAESKKMGAINAAMPNQSQIPTRAYAQGGVTPAPSINSNAMMAEGGDSQHVQNLQQYGVDQTAQMEAAQRAAEAAAPISPINRDAAIAQQQEAIRQQYAAREAARQAAAPQAPTPQDQGYTQLNAEGGEAEDNSGFTQKPKEHEHKRRQENTLDYSKFKKDKPEGGTLNYPALQQEYHKKNRYAEGGKVPKYCMYCGGMAHGGECSIQDQGDSRKMYANPSQEVSPTDSAPTTNADPSQEVSPTDSAPTTNAGNGPVDQAVPNYQDPMAATQGQAQAPEQQITPEAKERQDIYDATKNMPNYAAKVGTPESAEDNPETFAYARKHGTQVQNLDPQLVAQASATQTMQQNINAANMSAEQNNIIAMNQSRATMGLAPLPIPQIPNGQQIPGTTGNPAPNATPDGQPIPQNILPPTPDEMSQSMQNSQDMMFKGYNEALSGIRGSAAATGALGAAREAVFQQQAKDKSQALAEYQKEYGNLQKERKQFIEDYQNGHIDPEQYWKGDKNGNGSHSKIASAIGMILAGFNPTNKPNAAIDFLKYQMDKNIEGQIQNMNAKHNLLAANMHQFGVARDAVAMTQIMQNDMIQAELNQAAAKYASPLAKAASQQAAGQLQMEMAPRFQQFAMQQAMMKLANNGGSPGSVDHMIAAMYTINPKDADNMSERYVPGVGLSPTTKVPADVRQKLIAHQDLHIMATNMLNYVQTHTNLVHGSPEWRIGVDMARNLQQVWRQAKFGGIMREGEQPMLDKVLPMNPAGALKAFTSIPDLKTMIDSNLTSFNTLKKAYNLPETKVQQPMVIRKTQDGKSAMFDPNKLDAQGKPSLVGYK